MSLDAPIDTPKTVARSTFAFLSGTFLSRLSGFGRDTAMAVIFGCHPAVAAFMVAFRFANLIRRLFGEGPLASGFVPHFEQMRAEAPEKGATFFRDLFFSLGAFLVLLIGALEGILWGVLHWGNLQPDNAQIVQLTALMLPGVLFICLFGLSSGFLQCQRRFFLTGFAPVAFNLVWIGSVLFLKGRAASDAVAILSFAVVGAFFLQWGSLVPQTFRQLREHLSWKQCLTPRLFTGEIRAMCRPLLLGIIGVGAMQVNSALDAIFARCASLEGPAYLWYAIRIQQVPLALFGIALSTALLPSLARAFKSGAMDRYRELLRFGLRRSFSLILPCSFGIFVLGISGINLLYGHGDFSLEATCQTALCLWGYGLGLLPAVFVLLLAPAFYAARDFRVPVIGSVASVALNGVITAVLVFGFELGAMSIAIATSLCAWFNYLYLAHKLAKKLGEPLFDRSVLASFARTAACSVIAAVATVLVGLFFVDDLTLPTFLGDQALSFERALGVQLMQFAALAGTFVLLLFSYAWLFHAADLLELVGIRRAKVEEVR